RNVSDIERYEHAEQYRRWLSNPLDEWEALHQGGLHGDDQ
ncbi:glutathione-regulated potassium-efflux system ancillary protein KefG, partial [Vibrio parahaemolyticus]|nr:glutathione-regulated potassium-efflux system ancillary protein KefG [Vibrio parahaemolyticus]